ncbi:MAG: putative DNA modification/repair radical SAM protein [Brevinematales bacterium]|nr:putative DNA modification/repair radical SAM protein [Brevinematales bacterium]
MITLFDKLSILGISSQYDSSCGGGLEERVMPGVYRSSCGDGGCYSLLKILLTNYCEYDCAYCVNRKSNDIKRVIFTADEICELTRNYYDKGLIDGLFLSSGVIKNVDFTMELMLRAVKKLRFVYNYRGYIHLKIMPGCSEFLIDEAIKYANRVSVNLEIPNLDGLHKLCPEKKEENLLKPIRYINQKILENGYKKGQTSQLIIGATKDNDFQILKLSDNLYKKANLKRVYYSSFENVNNNLLPPDKNLPMRERRLYQADWLVRVYNFNLNEIIKPGENLSLDFDPKTKWAIENVDLFPIEITKACFDELVRTPGIGFVSAKKIIEMRKNSYIDLFSLSKIGVVLKKARHFITINGRFYGFKTENIDKLKEILSEKNEELLLFNE